MTPRTAANPTTLRKAIIVFDGGSRGNPGEGYGSYCLDYKYQSDKKQPLSGTGKPVIVRQHLGERMTNNEAEYDILIAALSTFLGSLELKREDPQEIAVEIRGDSQLVISQVTGEWRARETRLALRRDKVRALLARFGQYRLVHQPRAKSVALLGH